MSWLAIYPCNIDAAELLNQFLTASHLKISILQKGLRNERFDVRNNREVLNELHFGSGSMRQIGLDASF